MLERDTDISREEIVRLSQRRPQPSHEQQQQQQQQPPQQVGVHVTVGTGSKPVYSYHFGIKSMVFRCFLQLYVGLVKILI